MRERIFCLAGRSGGQLGRVSAFLLLVGFHAAVAVAGEEEQILEALAVREGMRIADVGAGGGEWAVRLAHRVGASGHVYATEIDAEDVARIERRVRDAELANVTAVLGTEDDSGLPDRCCDAILLRLVYHHLTEPSAMRRSLWRALRPGARLLVIEFPPNPRWPTPPGVPDRGGHGVGREDVVREMTSDGFELLGEHAHWGGFEDRFGVIFRRPAGASAPPARPDSAVHGDER